MSEREILFRGYTGREWVYGYLSMNREKTRAFIQRDISDIHFEVKLNTVSQFTGLTDRNGTKIFEGDIVKHTRLNGSGLIVFRDGAFWLKINVCAKKLLVWFCNHGEVEVIGNIHDNPELLRGE